MLLKKLKMNQKKETCEFVGMLLGILAANFLGRMLAGKIVLPEVSIPILAVIRSGKGCQHHLIL